MGTHKAFHQLSKTLEAGLPGFSEAEREAIAKAWINECGGSLYYEIAQEIEELSKGNKVETDPELFEKTRRVFQEAGKSDLEHLMWREKEMRTACLVEEMRIFREINPDYERYDENDMLIPRARPNKEPTISRSQLETAVAKDYVAHGTEYIDVLEQTEQNNARPQPQDACKASQNQAKSRKNNLPPITYDDLVGEELTTKEVIDWLKSEKPHIYKELSDPIQRLRDCARRASSGKPKGQMTEPIRLQTRKGSTWSDIALIHKGKSGPGGGNIYKKVRADTAP